MRASVVKLVSYVVTYDEIGQPVHTSSDITVPCTVSSITRNEWSAAGVLGINPDVRLTTPLINYSGQTEAEFEGVDYSIYRTYERGDIVELYLQRKAGI